VQGAGGAHERFRVRHLGFTLYAYLFMDCNHVSVRLDATAIAVVAMQLPGRGPGTTPSLVKAIVRSMADARESRRRRRRSAGAWGPR
jgi:hypothetical protein